MVLRMFATVDNTRMTEAGALACAALAVLVYNWRANALPKRIQEEKYQGGESYGDPPKTQTGLFADLQSMGSLKKLLASAQTVFDLAKGKGKPVNDKEMVVSILGVMLLVYDN